VVQRVNGAHSGFVLAGRNMREVEAREEQVRQMAGVTWIGMLGVILVGTAIFGWYTRSKVA
jgi:Tfp pilus assembly protein PilN